MMEKGILPQIPRIPSNLRPMLPITYDLLLLEQNPESELVKQQTTIDDLKQQQKSSQTSQKRRRRVRNV